MNPRRFCLLLASVVFLAVVGVAFESSAEWPAKFSKAEAIRRAESLPDVEVVESDNGEHLWLIKNGKTWVGAHNDQIGTWIDLRSAGAKSFPEFAVFVPKDGGAPRLQVSRTNGVPVTVDLVKAAAILNRLIEESSGE